VYLDQLIERGSRNIDKFPDVLKYLMADRMITYEEIKKYSLGYTAIANIAGSGEDYDTFKKDTYGFKALEKKLLIPLKNLRGNSNGVIIGRIKQELNEDGSKKPKYRQLFLKEAKDNGAFFGLHEALPSILETGVVYITEGAIDCISLAKVLPNTVSVLTSFMTEEQYWTLSMIADKIVVVFDSDEAGRNGVDIIKNKYKSKNITSKDVGYNDVNAALLVLGEQGFESYVRKKIEMKRFF